MFKEVYVFNINIKKKKKKKKKVIKKKNQIFKKKKKKNLLIFYFIIFEKKLKNLIFTNFIYTKIHPWEYKLIINQLDKYN